MGWFMVTRPSAQDPTHRAVSGVQGPRRLLRPRRWMHPCDRQPPGPSGTPREDAECGADGRLGHEVLPVTTQLLDQLVLQPDILVTQRPEDRPRPYAVAEVGRCHKGLASAGRPALQQPQLLDAPDDLFGGAVVDDVRSRQGPAQTP